jgi:hypothetical protein
MLCAICDTLRFQYFDSSGKFLPTIIHGGARHAANGRSTRFFGMREQAALYLCHARQINHRDFAHASE